jgi:DNA-directed RNA polymerase specialized sigma24 family protein
MRTGDDDAEFTAFVAAPGPALLRTAYLLTGDHQAGEDLVQTALAKTYVAWPRIRARDAVETYVRRTMVTTQVSWWRRHWRRTPDLPFAVAGLRWQDGDHVIPYRQEDMSSVQASVCDAGTGSCTGYTRFQAVLPE